MQIFDGDKEPQDLSLFCSFIEDKFYKDNKIFIKKLLREGIICTPMLRNARSGSLHADLANYFERAVDSVAAPAETKRYKVTSVFSDPALQKWDGSIAWQIQAQATLKIEQEVTDHDALSPPWFLRHDDSMGAFSREERWYDPLYGEAIIEIRAPQALEIGQDKDGFLEEHEAFLQDAKVFLKFLSNFHEQTEDNVLKTIHDKIKLTKERYQK